MENSRVVIVTGASRGLGLALAKEFNANGWNVVGTGISERPADLPENVEYAQFDASGAAACEQFWQETLSKYAGYEVCLVNNAGGYVGGAVAETSPEDYETQIHMNYLPAVHMTQGLVKAVEKARIITIVSATALSPKANNSAYGASKAAEQYFLQALQAELDDKKYRLTNIYPNAIATTGPNPKAITPEELAAFVRDQAELEKSYYIRDAVLYSFV